MNKTKSRRQVPMPKGFLFSAVQAAIKKPGRKDLALICSDKEAVISGVFTTNRVKAAPVLLDMKRIRSGRGQAIIVNSGNANACTGRQGMKDTVEMADLVARGLRIREDLVYVCSTGVIGTPLPMDRIRRQIPELISGIGKGTFNELAHAIMTTDSFPKTTSKRIRLEGSTVTIAGACKGAGMIRPRMATMLCFLITDAQIDRAALDSALKHAVSSSFNRITVDGDMSTNDTVLFLASGAARNSVIKKNSPSYTKFLSAAIEVTYELGKMVVRDGEGATKLVEVVVRNARNEKDAERGAFAIANSLLVKTAVYGNDANWGRIMAALGYSGIAMKEEKTDIFFGKVRIVSRGVATGKDALAAKELRENEVSITVDLHLGSASAKVLTCDLTEEYIRINAEYRT